MIALRRLPRFTTDTTNMKDAAFPRVKETQQTAPSYATRNRTRFIPLNQEAMLACVKTSKLKVTQENPAKRKIPEYKCSTKF